MRSVDRKLKYDVGRDRVLNTISHHIVRLTDRTPHIDVSYILRTYISNYIHKKK